MKKREGKTIWKFKNKNKKRDIERNSVNEY